MTDFNDCIYNARKLSKIKNNREHLYKLPFGRFCIVVRHESSLPTKSLIFIVVYQILSTENMSFNDKIQKVVPIKRCYDKP